MLAMFPTKLPFELYVFGVIYLSKHVCQTGSCILQNMD